jgi:Xaa-Pro aminopeptidase
MGEKLRSLGLIKNVVDSEIRKYFPHATSHFLGYDVHDVGDYSRPLEPGVVLTVEPGIYVADEGIGIRIEDDVLITSTGAERLTSDLSRDL